MFSHEYDLDVSVFSPQGRLYQVEYAMKAATQGSSAVGIRGPKYSVLVGVSKSNSKLANPVHKLMAIDTSLGAAMSGLTMDTTKLVKHLRTECTTHRFRHGSSPLMSRLLWDLGHMMQISTQRYDRRPYGVEMLLASYDDVEMRPKLHYVCGASSNSFECRAYAIGKRARLAIDFLEQHPVSENPEQWGPSALFELAIAAVSTTVCDDSAIEPKWLAAAIVGEQQPFRFLSEQEIGELLGDDSSKPNSSGGDGDGDNDKEKPSGDSFESSPEKVPSASDLKELISQLERTTKTKTQTTPEKSQDDVLASITNIMKNYHKEKTEKRENRTRQMKQIRMMMMRRKEKNPLISYFTTADFEKCLEEFSEASARLKVESGLEDIGEGIMKDTSFGMPISRKCVKRSFNETTREVEGNLDVKETTTRSEGITGSDIAMDIATCFDTMKIDSEENQPSLSEISDSGSKKVLEQVNRQLAKMLGKRTRDGERSGSTKTLTTTKNNDGQDGDEIAKRTEKMVATKDGFSEGDSISGFRRKDDEDFTIVVDESKFEIICGRVGDEKDRKNRDDEGEKKKDDDARK